MDEATRPVCVLVSYGERSKPTGLALHICCVFVRALTVCLVIG